MPARNTVFSKPIRKEIVRKWYAILKINFSSLTFFNIRLQYLWMPLSSSVFVLNLHVNSSCLSTYEPVFVQTMSSYGWLNPDESSCTMQVCFFETNWCMQNKLFVTISRRNWCYLALETSSKTFFVSHQLVHRKLGRRFTQSLHNSHT